MTQSFFWAQKHCLAVINEGCIFGRGANGCGELCLGDGCFHLFLETCEIKILSIGANDYGHLLLSWATSWNEKVYLPTETAITCGAAFCITGDNLSVAFIRSGPQRNIPNTWIDGYHWFKWYHHLVILINWLS